MDVVNRPPGDGSTRPGPTRVVQGRVLVAGEGRGPLLSLTHPISFWGGVDPVRGTIVDPRHPQHGRSIKGTVLMVPTAVGSSSSSAIMLELLREGTAPAAILVEVPAEQLADLFDGVLIEVDRDGVVRINE
jgi:predicted aconitase with swiveling domain